MKEIPLHKLKEGRSGVVTEISQAALPQVRQRLTDLGLIPGTRIECLYTSPLKDPAAYKIRGTVIALRREDSSCILVEPVETEEESATGKMTVALAGNPNVGKSTVFNILTGLRQHTGNWAGKTVDSASGTWSFTGGTGESKQDYCINLVDIPGCYSMESCSPEEEVSRKFLQSGQCSGVIVVCDGTCLQRNLILVLQIQKLMPRTAVCINMMDQVRSRGLDIDDRLLSELLGVPVILTESRKPDMVRRAMETLIVEGWPGSAEAADREPAVSGPPAADTEDLAGSAAADSAALVLRAEEIADRVVNRTEEKPDSSRRIDRILTSPWTGFPIMAVMLLAIFWLTLKGASYPSEVLGNLLFSLEPPLYELLRSGLGLPVFFCEMTASGMYRVLAWVVSVMLPPMAIFFPLFTLLEDWGFLPRVAFNLDRCFHCCQACGKQALTMCMGLGCNASAVVGCRIIDSRRERLIAMVTNSLVPCNGRFPLLISIITMFFAWGPDGKGSGLTAALMLTGVILTGIGATLLLSKILSLTLLRGTPSSFTLELPPFRRPQFGKVILRSVLDRTIFVLARAMAIAAPAGLIIYLLANLETGSGNSLLTEAAELLDPAGRIIGMDGVILLAFLLGLPASEIVMPMMLMIYMNQSTLTEITDLTFFRSLLVENGWTMLTALNVMIFSLMHWPCATSILSIRKESGSWRWTIVSVLAPLALGVIFCLVTTAVSCKIC